MTAKEKVEQYYKGLDAHRELYYNDNSISGFFNYEKIEIGINGIDEKFYLEKIQNDFSSFIKNKGEDYPKKYAISDFEKLPQNIKEGLKFVQILHHESLHVLQTFTLQACNEHMYWVRNFKDLEFAVFSLNILYGYKWKIKDEVKENIIGENCWEWIESRERWISAKFEDYGNLKQDICENFTNLKTRKLSTIDLVEGEAFAFQELTTDSIGKKIFNPPETSIYKKAYQYFLSKIENENNYADREKYSVFIVMCHLSLKFGSSRYTGDKNTASAIFDYLTNHILDYLKEFKRSLISVNQNTDKESWLLNNQYSNSLNVNQIFFFKKLAILTDKVESTILKYHREYLFSPTFMLGREEKFYSKTVQHFDRKMKPILNYLNSNYKGFDTKYFLPLLIASNDFVLRKFTNCISDIGSLRTKSPNGKDVSISDDNFIFQIMSDFQQLLKIGQTFCCEEHNITSFRTIEKCSNNNSLLKRFKNIFGKNFEFQSIIEK